MMEYRRKLITIIVLTKNEERHIPRLIRSISSLEAELCIVDSYSDDDTMRICRSAGARVYQNHFINQAAQLQWALDNCDINSEWIMRMDADEYITPLLADEIRIKLPALDPQISGVVLKRQVHFMGQWIRHGGYYPVKLLRIWRNGKGTIEQKWMDEHVVLKSGSAVEFEHDFVDDNLNSLSWWTEKHNYYATREAIDILNRQYGFFDQKEHQNGLTGQVHSARKRWYKENMYLKMPLFLRAFLYFNYRYFLRFGFLDGTRGLVWHLLQGFWYRFLVDAKIYQIKWYARKEKASIRDVIEHKFNVKIDF